MQQQIQDQDLECSESSIDIEHIEGLYSAMESQNASQVDLPQQPNRSPMENLSLQSVYVYDDSSSEINNDQSNDMVHTRAKLEDKNFNYLTPECQIYLQSVMDQLGLNICFQVKGFKEHRIICEQQQQFNQEKKGWSCSICYEYIGRDDKIVYGYNFNASCSLHPICDICQNKVFWSQYIDKEETSNSFAEYEANLKNYQSYKCPFCKSQSTNRILVSKINHQIEDYIFYPMIFEPFSQKSIFTTQTIRLTGLNRRTIFITIQDLLAQEIEYEQILKRERLNYRAEDLQPIQQVPNYYMYYEEFIRHKKALHISYYYFQKFSPNFTGNEFYYYIYFAIQNCYLRKMIELYQRVSQQATSEFFPQLEFVQMFNFMTSQDLQYMMDLCKIQLEYHYYLNCPQQFRSVSSYSTRLKIYENSLQAFMRDNAEDNNTLVYINQTIGHQKGQIPQKEQLKSQYVPLKRLFSTEQLKFIIKRSDTNVFNGDVLNYMQILRHYFTNFGMNILDEFGHRQTTIGFSVMINHLYTCFFFELMDNLEKKCDGEECKGGCKLIKGCCGKINAIYFY